MVIVVEEDCAENRYQTSLVVVCEQLVPLLGPSFVASCKSPTVPEHEMPEVSKTELPQVLLADCPSEINGIAVRESNKIISRIDFRYKFGFIAIRIEYGLLFKVQSLILRKQ